MADANKLSEVLIRGQAEKDIEPIIKALLDKARDVGYRAGLLKAAEIADRFTFDEEVYGHPPIEVATGIAEEIRRAAEKEK